MRQQSPYVWALRAVAVVATDQLFSVVQPSSSPGCRGCFFFVRFTSLWFWLPCLIWGSGGLWRRLQPRSKVWHLDTQLVESMNSTIRQTIQAAPHIGLELLSARLAIRRSIANGKAAEKELVEEAVQPRA